MNKHQEIENLFDLYLKDKCTQEQLQLLMKYLLADKHESIFKRLISDELESSNDKDFGNEMLWDLDKLYQSIIQKIEKPNEE